MKGQVLVADNSVRKQYASDARDRSMLCSDYEISTLLQNNLHLLTLAESRPAFIVFRVSFAPSIRAILILVLRVFLIPETSILRE